MSNNRLHISIAFGDAVLPVVRCEDGHERVPLKPIVEQVGAQWEGQRRKLQPEKYLHRRLGIKSTPLKCGGNPQICARLDRITAYLNTLNPENIRGMGNHDAANWLEAKHEEWDNVLHAYENAGDTNKGKGAAGIKQLTDLFKVRITAKDEKEQAALTLLIHQQLSALGVDLNTMENAQGELAV